MKPVEYAAADLGFDRSAVSVGALAVIDRLQGAGFDGYLVGGCVRDLLLKRQPEDFDVTTNARPEQVKKLFDRARIIGRRFRLVHVYCHGRGRRREVIEVATYRASPTNRGSAGSAGNKNGTIHSGRIVDDNVYGSIDADAIRRDFTINAFYYDPCREVVLDFVGGMDDMKTRTLSVIGDVATRFAEDPVRMLRVVRFQAKLDLVAEAEVAAAINQYAFLIEDVPSARMFDEVLKLFHYQCASKTWQAICRTSLAKVLFPQTVQSMQDRDGDRLRGLIAAALKNTDVRVASDQPVIPGFVFAVLLWGPFKRALKQQHKSGLGGNQACLAASEKVFRVQDGTVSVPWRARSSAVGIWELQAALERRVEKSTHYILQRRWFRAAYDFLLLRSEVGEVDAEIADWWTHRQGNSEAGRSVRSAGYRQAQVNLGTDSAGRRKPHRAGRREANAAERYNRTGTVGNDRSDPGNPGRGRRRRRSGNRVRQN